MQEKTKIKQSKKLAKGVKSSKGITLIALVITIIVMLILSGIAIVTLTGNNGLITQANRAKEETEKAQAKEQLNILLQDVYINEYVGEMDKMEYLREELPKYGAEKIWDFKESYIKEYWKLDDIIIILSSTNYDISNGNYNTLVNNTGNSSEKGFLVDISQGGIARKNISSITIRNTIPDNYTISYDVSEQKNGNIMLYATEKENGMYDVFIVSANNAEIYAPEDSARLFGDLSNLKSIDLENLNTSEAIIFQNIFCNCETLENIDISNLNTKNVQNMANMFYNCKNLKNIQIGALNTESVTTMQGMFSNCTKLVDINIENLITTNVTDMSMMFNNCSSLESLNLSKWNTSKVTTMYYMFNKCNKLLNLDISNFNTENVTTMVNMFYLCTSLPSLNLQSFNTKNVENMVAMFAYCSNLNVIYGGKNWNTNNARTESMFYSCGANTVTIVSD